MKRDNISTGGKWEPVIGYSRAVKVGPFVYVSGCTSATPEGVQGKGDAYAQAVQTLKSVVDALAKAGAKPGDVVTIKDGSTPVGSKPSAVCSVMAALGTRNSASRWLRLGVVRARIASQSPIARRLSPSAG